jgi:nitroreductase
VVVRDRARLAAIAALGRQARWLAGAAVLVAIVQTERHEYDAGRCAQNMMLAAWGEGIGSCPAHVAEAELGALLGVPAGLHVNRVIGFGYIDPERAGPPTSVGRRRLPIEELTHWEAWGT